MSLILDKLYFIVWGYGTVGFLLLFGFALLVFCRFFPLLHPWEICRNTLGQCLKPPRKPGGISPFAAMSTALGGTMGVGNIIGVAAAISIGGAGAVFWLWIAGLCGMMTKYSEVFLAVKYRIKGKDGFHGGPMYILSRGLGMPVLGGVFAVLCVLASFGMGNMAQSNAICASLLQSFGIAPLVGALITGAVVGFVVLGGMGRIVRVSSKIVPLMSALYLLGALWVLMQNLPALPAVFGDIFAGAFGIRPVGGASVALMWQAMQVGISKGIFTNEAGMGSASIAHACADESDPHKQGLWGIFEVCADTILVCTLTALVILSTGVHLTECSASGMTAAAFGSVLGVWGGRLVNLSVVFFALASLFSWCLYGEKALGYLSQRQDFLRMYRWIFVLLAVVGGVVRLELIWQISDILNGMMLFPNMVGLVLLSPQIVAAIRHR